MVAKARDVEIRIKATDQTQRAVNNATTALDRFAAAQSRTAKRRDLIQAVETSKQAYQDATAEVGRLASETEGKGVRAQRRLAGEMDVAKAAARAAKTEFHANRDALSGVTTEARGSYAAFEQIATGARRAETAVESLTRETNELRRAQRATGAAGTGGDFADRLTSAYASRHGRGPLGLRPYELQNLGYQVNDLITQIASGTPPMQAFAQQGGQIAQIFPQATGALLRFLPVIGLVTLALGPLVGAIMRTNAEVDRVKEIDRILTRSGEAATYNAEQLLGVARSIDAMGASADEATSIVDRLVTQSVDPTYLAAFGRAALDTSKVLKMDVADAADMVTEAFTGNADAILALDDRLNFLTDSERAEAEAMRKSRKEAELRIYTFDIYSRKMGDTAGKMRGEWSTILNNFGQAWRAFGDWMLRGIRWDAIRSQIQGLISLVADLTSRLPGVRTQTYAATQSLITQRERELAQARTAEQAAGRGQGALAGTPLGRMQAGRGNNGAGSASARVRQLEGELVVLRTRLAGQSLTEGRSEIVQGASDTTRDPPPPAYTPSSSGQSDAERRLEQQRDFLASLNEENAARAFQISLIDKAARESEILTAIEEARKGALEVGLELTDAQAEAIRTSVGNLYDAQRAAEATRTIEAARLDLAQRRGEVESRSAYVTRLTAENLLGATDEQRAAYAVILGQMYDMEETRRRQADLEKAISDQQAIRSELMSQFEIAAAQDDQALMATLQERIDAVNLSLGMAIQQIIAFWQTQTGPEAEAAILRWSGLASTIQDAGATAIVSGKQINDMIASGGSNALDRFAQQLVETRNLFGSLEDAVRQYAAEFLRQIAQMTAQQILFNVVSGISGGGNLAGVGGAGGFLSGLIGTGGSIPVKKKHNGGLATSAGSGIAWVSPSVFDGAYRFHGGGIAGLMPDEVPAILQRDEEVITRSDPRHRGNGGLGGGATNIRNVIAFDPVDLLERAFSTEAGEQLLISVIGRNADAVKGTLG